MRTTLARALAVGAAALAMLTMTTGVVPAHAAAPTCAGVWVVVQPDEAAAASASAKCATEYANGTQALTSAGFALEESGGMVSRINALPTDGNYATNGGYYWSYWHTTVTTDGTLGKWEYYSTGAAASKPAIGTAEGWLLTKSTAATGPAMAQIPTTAAATSQPGVLTDNSGVFITAGVVVFAAAIGAGLWVWKRKQD